MIYNFPPFFKYEKLNVTFVFLKIFFIFNIKILRIDKVGKKSSVFKLEKILKKTIAPALKNIYFILNEKKSPHKEQEIRFCLQAVTL